MLAVTRKLELLSTGAIGCATEYRRTGAALSFWHTV